LLVGHFPLLQIPVTHEIDAAVCCGVFLQRVQTIRFRDMSLDKAHTRRLVCCGWVPLCSSTFNAYNSGNFYPAQQQPSTQLSLCCVQWLTGPAVHCVQPVMSCPLNCKDSPQRKVSRDSRMCSNYIVRYYPSRRQSWGIGVSATFGCLFVRTIYQEPLQLGSPNLT